MTLPRRIKARSAGARLVAVVASETDLVQAARLRRLPDFFELRLDSLHSVVSASDGRIPRLRAPIILTARAPREGGIDNLADDERCSLLLEFLNHAAYVDIEIDSAASMRPVLLAAKARNLKRIMSVHALGGSVTIKAMQGWAVSARTHSADIFKIAVRTDTVAELERLLAFFEQQKTRMDVAAMGVGKFGRRSRIELAGRGSALNYAHLGAAAVDGQLSLRQLRDVLGKELAPSPRGQ